MRALAPSVTIAVPFAPVVDAIDHGAHNTAADLVCDSERRALELIGWSNTTPEELTDANRWALQAKALRSALVLRACAEEEVRTR